jgi:hypothetical protein
VYGNTSVVMTLRLVCGQCDDCSSRIVPRSDLYCGGCGSRETLVEQERDWTGLVMGQKGVYNNNNGQKHTCVQLRTATGMLRLGFFTNQQHLFSFRFVSKCFVPIPTLARGNFRHLQLLGGQK